jgi:hypothetical protein
VKNKRKFNQESEKTELPKKYRKNKK